MFEAEVTVRRTRFASEETGWAVVEAAGEDGTPVVLVGPLVHLEDHERARVVGTWVKDSRYGPQVKVTEATPLAPTDADGPVAIAYLVRVKHVGVKRATRLVETYGAGAVFDVIDRDPYAAFTAAGIRSVRAAEATSSWERLRVTRRLHLLLAPHGLAYLAARIRETYGDGAHRIVSERPYELTSVFGVGFLIADRIAQRLGVEQGSPDRARAAVLHVLSEAERGGSTCLPLDLLVSSAGELLGPRRNRRAGDRRARRGVRSRSRRAVDLPDADRRARGGAGRARPRPGRWQRRRPPQRPGRGSAVDA